MVEVMQMAMSTAKKKEKWCVAACPGIPVGT
jgi:hypothetical protein